MYVKLGQPNIWPTREQVDLTMPNEFQKTYQSTRIIIDATEIKVEKSNSMLLQ